MQVKENRADKTVGTSLLSSPKHARTEPRRHTTRILSARVDWRTYGCRTMELRETGGQKSTSDRQVRPRYVDSQVLRTQDEHFLRPNRCTLNFIPRCLGCFVLFKTCIFGSGGSDVRACSLQRRQHVAHGGHHAHTTGRRASIGRVRSNSTSSGSTTSSRNNGAPLIRTKSGEKAGKAVTKVVSN